jgi:hypothetical protein
MRTAGQMFQVIRVLLTHSLCPPQRGRDAIGAHDDLSFAVDLPSIYLPSID